MSVRDEVKEATIRVIATEGVPAVTIRRVAREVGRSTSAITHYFADRDELLREAVSETHLTFFDLETMMATLSPLPMPSRSTALANRFAARSSAPYSIRRPSQMRAMRFG